MRVPQHIWPLMWRGAIFQTILFNFPAGQKEQTLQTGRPGFQSCVHQLVMANCAVAFFSVTKCSIVMRIYEKMLIVAKEGLKFLSNMPSYQLSQTQESQFVHLCPLKPKQFLSPAASTMALCCGFCHCLLSLNGHKRPGARIKKRRIEQGPAQTSLPGKAQFLTDNHPVFKPLSLENE